MNFSKADLASNPNLLKAISPKDAQLLGLLTPEQAKPIRESLPSSTPSTGKTKTAPPSKPELQSHAEFLAWIKKLNRSLPTDKPLLALHADPTTPSGIMAGWPDFSLFYNASYPPLFLEFKRPRQGRLSPAQSLIHRYLKNLGHELHLVFSAAQAINISGRHFELSPIHYLPQI